MSRPINIDTLASYFEPGEPRIAMTCPENHPLTETVHRFLREGLRSNDDDAPVDLEYYQKKSHGAEVKFRLPEVQGSRVSMEVILLEEGQIGNPEIAIESPAYIEEIYDGASDEIIKIQGKKILFSLSAEGQLYKSTAFGASMVYSPYPGDASGDWGNPVVASVSPKGFLVEREVSAQEEKSFFDYLGDPANLDSLTEAIKCTDKDLKMREQKRLQVIECVASERRHEERMIELSKPRGISPL